MLDDQLWIAVQFIPKVLGGVEVRVLSSSSTSNWGENSGFVRRDIVLFKMEKPLLKLFVVAFRFPSGGGLAQTMNKQPQTSMLMGVLDQFVRIFLTIDYIKRLSSAVVSRVSGVTIAAG